LLALPVGVDNRSASISFAHASSPKESGSADAAGSSDAAVLVEGAGGATAAAVVAAPRLSETGAIFGSDV
jgi:hypothetical protein